jgi:hypothetical protein
VPFYLLLSTNVWNTLEIQCINHEDQAKYEFFARNRQLSKTAYVEQAKKRKYTSNIVV